MKVEIWSDVMCPFCYIGKRKFEEALAGFKHKDEITVEWKSFQLNPDLITDTETTITQYLADAKGWSREQAVQAHQMVVKMAEEVGLHFNFDKIVVANSFKAHQLIQYAKSQDKGDEVEESLFKAYFIDGENIDDITVLNQIAEKSGLPPLSLEQVLAEENYSDSVKKDIFESRQIGVRGVPFFLFNEKYALSGAQPPSVFSQILDQTFAEWTQNRPVEVISLNGQSCDIDGDC